MMLFNGYIAVDQISAFSGNDKVKQGRVVMVAAGVTDIAAADVIFFPFDKAMTVKYQGVEYMVVKQTDAMGKL